MRRLLGLAIISFTISLGIVVGHRLSSEAMAVVVGIVLGVLASVPTSLLLLVLIRRLTVAPPRRQQPRQHPQTPYPPVIVINPNAGPPNRYSSPLFEPPGNPPEGYLPREFRIIGEEDEEEEDR